MSNIFRSEFVFVAMMTILLLIFACFAVYMFFRQFRLEKAGREKLNAELAAMIAEREAKKAAQREEQKNSVSENPNLN